MRPRAARRLEVQYRMHQRIMQFSSREFYEDSLRADAGVRDHLLRDIAQPQAPQPHPAVPGQMMPQTPPEAP